MPEHRSRSDAVSQPPAQAEKRAARLRVLIVEDIPTVAGVLQAGLHTAGMDVELAMTGAEAIASKLGFNPDFVLVDLDLANSDTGELVRRFAGQGRCGVIALTAPGGTIDMARDIGADDYVAKPVRVRELAARIRTLHRRLLRPAAKRPAPIVVDHATRSLSGGNRSNISTELSDAELIALDTLLDAQGGSVSRAWLNRVALKRVLPEDDHSLDELMRRLRRKLAHHGASGRTIQAVRRQGYLIPDSTMFESIYSAEQHTNGPYPGNPELGNPGIS